ncbi:MAG: glycosyltransferase family 39 protein [Paludibacteraceae bacterium]
MFTKSNNDLIILYRNNQISPTVPHYLPKYYSSKAISLYIGALVLCNILFFNRVLSPMFWMFGIVEVFAFFYFSNKLTRKWTASSDKRFVKRLFKTALTIRVVWVIFSYYFYMAMTGQPFEWGSADAMGYHESALWIVDLLKNGKLSVFIDSLEERYSDMGYSLYLGLQYYVTGSSVFIARLLKAIYGAYTCVLIYQLAKRNFGEETGRMAAIFCMLMPTLILYAGLHTKEVEMVFLTVAFMERTDKLLRGKKYSFSTLILPLILAGSLFFFRTVLGATAVFALFTTLILSSDKVMGVGKRMLLIIWVLVAIGYFVGGKIATEVEEVWAARNQTQQTSLEWRATRDNGNKFSKLAGGAVFAPMIFVIPFPTVVNTPNQQNQQLINGGNYVKNITGFF